MSNDMMDLGLPKRQPINTPEESAQAAEDLAATMKELHKSLIEELNNPDDRQPNDSSAISPPAKTPKR